MKHGFNLSIFLLRRQSRQRQNRYVGQSGCSGLCSSVVAVCFACFWCIGVFGAEFHLFRHLSGERFGREPMEVYN